MTKKDYHNIAKAIWQSGYLKDHNKVREQAKEQMRRLIASNIIGDYMHKANFDEAKFLQDCGLKHIKRTEMPF